MKMGELRYLLVFGFFITEFVPQCNAYVINGWTQARLKRVLVQMNRELCIDAHSKVGMIDYIKRNFYNTKAYEVGETLYNIKRKQAEMLEQYRGAIEKPHPQNANRNVYFFADISAFADEIKYGVEMIRDFDKLEGDREMREDEDMQVLRSLQHEPDDAPRLAERRARQRAYAYRQKKLMVARSDNPGLHEHFMKKIDADEDGFASELS